MANPSLQIGNDNWAIKEDNLLGYSTAGTRFVPQPITMTRATLGTRVNPSGLVEDVALLGSELVTNGDFSNGTTDWTVSSGTISVDNGRLKIDSVSGTTAEQTVTAIIGKTYKVTYDFTLGTATSGAVIITGGNYPTLNAPEGTNIFYSVATSTSFRVRPRLGSDGTMFVDNISVKEATIDNLPRVDYTDGTSSLLVEPQRTNLITYSEDFTQWSKEATVTLTSNYSTSPDGTNNATRVQLDADDSIYLSSLGSSKVFSIYVKGVAGETIRISNGVATMFTLTGNWDRLEVFDTSGSSTLISINTYSSATARDIQIWGAQLEESYVTSYIPTSGSTVTRNQETYEKSGISDKINSTEGTLFLELATNNVTTFKNISINSDGSNRVNFFIYTSSVTVNFDVGGVTQASLSYSIPDVTSFNKFAFTYKLNEFKLFVNGTQRATDTSGIVPSANTFDTVSFNDSFGNNFYGKVKQLQVFKTALTDSELATLTT